MIYQLGNGWIKTSAKYTKYTYQNPDDRTTDNKFDKDKKENVLINLNTTGMINKTIEGKLSAHKSTIEFYSAYSTGLFVWQYDTTDECEKDYRWLILNVFHGRQGKLDGE